MKYSNTLKLISIILFMALSFVALSCGTTKNSSSENPRLEEFDSFKLEKSGAILWGENCSRCHQAPDPAAFSDEQWVAIGTHMRIRAGLTAEDTNKIIEFLQQSN